MCVPTAGNQDCTLWVYADFYPVLLSSSLIRDQICGFVIVRISIKMRHSNWFCTGAVSSENRDESGEIHLKICMKIRHFLHTRQLETCYCEANRINGRESSRPCKMLQQNMLVSCWATRCFDIPWQSMFLTVIFPSWRCFTRLCIAYLCQFQRTVMQNISACLSPMFC